MMRGIKMEIWDMFKLEKDRNKPIFLNYLKELLNAEEFEKLFRAIKISGIYISYDFRTVDKNQIEKVTNFVLMNLYSKFPEKVNNLFNEIKILENLKKKAFQKVDAIYDLLPKNKQAHYLSQYINNFFAVRMNSSSHQKSNASDLNDMDEMVILAFGMVIKDMERRGMVFTVANEITNHDSYLIGKHVEIASELRTINDIIETWMFSDIDIINDTKGNTLRINETGDFGKNKLMSQIPFFDLKAAKTAMKDFFSFENIDSYLHIGKDALKSKVQEYFYTDNFYQTYKGIPLNDWVNSYWCIYEYSLRLILNAESNNNLICHSVSEWSAILVNSGVSSVHVRSLIRYLTFSQKSKDLFDSPLIAFSGGLLCLPHMIPFVDISQSLMSQFGIDEDKENTLLNQKGTNFEAHINSLTKINIDSTITNLKRNIKNQPYEIDLIFHLDEDLFFVESKTQKQPGSHRDFYRNQEELSLYIKKFNRNVDYFINNHNEKKNIMNELGINNVKKVYRIFVSNVYQTEHFFRGVYITDEINYYLYMKRRPSAVNYINPNTNSITSINIDSNLYTGPISTFQFLAMITNKKINDRLKKRIGLRTIDLRQQQALIYRCYYIEVPNSKYYESGISKQEVMDDLKNNYL
jgi:Holliday junction resolvase-like predicted endonuclease